MRAESDRVRERASRQPADRVGRHRRGRRARSRASRPTSASTTARRSISRSTRPPATTASTSTASATTAATARARSRPITPSATRPQIQPACLTDAATGLVDCGNWAVSASWAVPANAVSGVYFAQADARRHRRREPHHLRRARRRSALATCCSRPPTRRGRPTTSTAATACTRAARHDRGPRVQGQLQPAVHHARRTDVGRGLAVQRRIPDGPLARAQRLRRQLHHRRRHRPPRAPAAQNHKVFLSVGHDEYWSGGQRANVEAARDAGVNLAFFSGNEVFWKTRWETASTAPATPYRTLVSYKETHANAQDRSADRRRGPAPGATRASARRPTAAARRTRSPARSSRVNCGTAAITRARGRTARCASGATPASPTLAPGQTATLRRGTLGYEWDEDLDNGSRPAGLSTCRRRPSNVHTSCCRLRQHVRRRHRDAQPDALPALRAARWCSAPARVQWTWGLDAESRHSGTGAAPTRHAAGDGQPVRRHGRSAGDTAVRASSATTVEPTSHRRPRRSRQPAAGAAVTPDRR